MRIAFPTILVSTRRCLLVLAGSGVALLAACGQKGPLVLPTGEAAVGRSTVVETLSPDPHTTLLPASAPAPVSSAPPTGTAAPGGRP
jgi:predicted small lipoprotein YifL